MRRTLAVLALSGLAATVVGSAASLAVDGSVIQAGSSTVTCDNNGIDANWGLELDDNSVRSVRFSGVDPFCQGAEMFVQVYDTGGAPIGGTLSTVIGATDPRVNLPAGTTPESIGSVKVWIEG
jgi:hypothetical protein